MTKVKAFLCGVLVVIALFLFIGAVAPGGETGRYQVVPLEKGILMGGSSGTMVLDTREGHLWSWSNFAGPTAATFLRYEGKVRPMSGMGTIVDTFPPVGKAKE